jgi:ppGpp synthetase/RelA/SpoT-type nucleotidyltranferase
LPNLDDPNPRKKGDTKSVEERRITDSIAELLNIKNNLDNTMYNAVDDIAKISPKDAVIYARTKTPYSIIQKLIGKRLLTPKDPKKGLTDLIGMTIAVDNFADLTKLRNLIEGGKMFNVYEVEDFYKNPLDGYMAVHYILLFKDANGTFPVELQLKTKRMKSVNEVSHKAYAQHNLDRDELLRVTSIVEKADKGDATAIKQYNELISDKDKLEDSFFKDKAKKFSGGGVSKDVAITAFFKNFGFNVEDIQPDEYDNGIEGWIVFYDNKNKYRVIDYATAKYLMVHDNTTNKTDIIKQSKTFNVDKFTGGGNIEIGTNVFAYFYEDYMGAQLVESPAMGDPVDGRITDIIQENGKKKYVIKFENGETKKLSESMFEDYITVPKYDKGGDVDKEEWSEIGKENNRMLRNQVREVAHHSSEINSTVGKKTKVEPWVVAKMERASTDLSDVTHYLDGDKYKYGGVPEVPELQFKEIASMTGMRETFIKDWATKNNLSSNDIGNLMMGLGRKQITVHDFSSALLGKPNNAQEKKILAYAKGNKGYKMSGGGSMYDDGGSIITSSGTLISKDKNKKLDYQKNGSDFKFVVYDSEKHPVQGYDKHTMNYNQFVNYIYSEGYIDDKDFNQIIEKGGSMYAGGGDVHKSTWIAVYQKGNGQNIVVVEARSKDEAIREAEMSKSHFGVGKDSELIDIYISENSKSKSTGGSMYSPGGEIKVGDWVAEKKGNARGKVYEVFGEFVKLEDKYGNQNNTMFHTRDLKSSSKPRYESGGDLDTNDFTNLPLGTRINAFIERRDKDMKGNIIEKTPTGYKIETHQYESYPVTYDEVTRVMSFPSKPEAQTRKKFLGLFDQGGNVFVDKTDGTIYMVGKNDKGQWTVFSKGKNYEKRDEFESGLANEQDAMMLAKVMAGVVDEFDPETNVRSYKYAGGGNTDSRLVDAERYGFSIRYFEETDPAFDVEYANDEYVIRVLGGADYDDYSVSITKGDYNEDAATFMEIKDANKFVIDFMKENEESRDFMNMDTMRYGGDVVRHFNMPKRFDLGGPVDDSMTAVQKYFATLNYDLLPSAFVTYVKEEILSDPELPYLSEKEPIFITIKEKVDALQNHEELAVEVGELDSNVETQEAIELLMELSEDLEGAEKQETIEAIELLKELLV